MDATALLADLDADQRRAVTTSSRLVAVVAGAGSGKTRVLTRRLAYRVATGDADEDHTVVLTFTREAAGELRRRLPALGLRGRVVAGTFHAVAHGLLQQRWRDLDQLAPTLVADRRRIVGRLLDDSSTPGLRSQRLDLDLLVAEIEWAGSRGIDAAGYESAAKRGERRPAIDPGVVAGVLDAYRREKRTRGVIDLDDLLGLTVEALGRDAGFADSVRWRFRHVLVDEAQDLNPLQHRLVDLIRLGHDDLFLVGDPSQSIYAFNGADPSLLLDVARRFPGIEIVRLPVNHRCTPQVVGAGVHVLAADDQPAVLESGRGDGPAVRIAGHDDEQAEADQVAAAIAAADRSLVRANQVAVLARTNAQLPPIAKALARVGVPVRHRVHGEGSPIRPALNHTYRLADGHELRRWAQDVLEDTAPDPAAGELRPEHEVGRAVLDFLRVQPTGDGAAFRAWVDANDPFGRTEAGVELLTFHAAKGREWHTVHLVGCETSLVPHRSATTVPARSEEARLLYVAITRATDALTVHWARRRGGYQRRLTPWLDGFESTAADAVAAPPELTLPERSPRELRIARLRTWRAELARAGGILPEAVCTDAVLAMIADHAPADADELDRLTQLGGITSRRLFPTLAEALADMPVS